jgi:hypothetical protein
MTEQQALCISKVYLWQNGFVMVFDQNGEQMPDYQGRLDHQYDRGVSVFELVQRDKTDKTEFFGEWPDQLPDNVDAYAAKCGLEWPRGWDGGENGESQ